MNGGPVFPGTILGYFGFCFFVLFLFFSSKFQNCTPWRNDQNLIVPVLIERKKGYSFGNLVLLRLETMSLRKRVPN